MKITSHQAAELLNCNPTTVWNLTRAGKIKNYAIVGEGRSRAEGRFELAEIAEFAKTFIPRKRGRPEEKSKKEKKSKKEIIISRTLDVLLERTKQMDGRLGSIEFALITLDQKIDSMVKTWT